VQYKIVNKLRQLQNILVRDSNGSSKTLTLMPKGKNNSERIIAEKEITDDVRSKEAMGYIHVQQMEK
jgi:hypothetical protein